MLGGHKFVCHAAVTEIRNNLSYICNRRVTNQLSIGRRRTHIFCWLFIKMTDIFNSNFHSRDYEISSPFSTTLYLSPFSTLFDLSRTSLFAFRTPGSFFSDHPSYITLSCVIIRSEHPISTLWTPVKGLKCQFQTSVPYLTNIRFIGYGHHVDFFPNTR